MLHAKADVKSQCFSRKTLVVGEGIDLPMVRPFFEEYVASFGLQSRVRFHNGDFFKDSLPSADVLAMGMILHDWNLEEKRTLLNKGYWAD